MATYEVIDWSQCSFVEINLQIQSRAPVLSGTRMPVNTIVDNFDDGLSVAEIMEQFEVSEEDILAVLEYAKNHRISNRG
jgi:uncharacterized protein (DUF433 family)